MEEICGIEMIVDTSYPTIANFIDLSGNTYNGVHIDKYAGINKDHTACYICTCHCGKRFVETRTHILNGIQSCGCIRPKYLHNIPKSDGRILHGETKTRLYGIWKGIRTRCYCKTNKKYINYGARGIKMCDEWYNDNGFINFKEWSLNNGYNDTKTIDRIDNNKKLSA